MGGNEHADMGARGRQGQTGEPRSGGQGRSKEPRHGTGGRQGGTRAVCPEEVSDSDWAVMQAGILPPPPPEGSQPPYLHLNLLGGGGQVGSHKPVTGCWVGDVEGSVALLHLDEEGGLHGRVGREAGAQRVDDRRGAVTEVPGHGGSRTGVSRGPGRAWAGGRAGTYTVISTLVHAGPPPRDTCSSQRSSTVSGGTRKWKSAALPYQP